MAVVFVVSCWSTSRLCFRFLAFSAFRFSPYARFVNPRVRLQPLERAGDALFNRQLGTPAGGADFLGIEEDERIVAHSALVAAGVFELGLEVERRADETDGVFDLHVFVAAEVVNFHAMFRFERSAGVHDVEDCTHTVADMEITFALGAVAEDAQMIRVIEELFVKVEHVAVGVAFTEN